MAATARREDQLRHGEEELEAAQGIVFHFLESKACDVAVEPCAHFLENIACGAALKACETVQKALRGWRISYGIQRRIWRLLKGTSFCFEFYGAYLTQVGLTFVMFWGASTRPEDQLRRAEDELTAADAIRSLESWRTPHRVGRNFV